MSRAVLQTERGVWRAKTQEEAAQVYERFFPRSAVPARRPPPSLRGQRNGDRR